MSILGSISKFISKISDCMGDNKYTELQRKHSELEKEYDLLLSSYDSCKEDCDSKTEAIKIEYDSQLSMLESEIEEAINPNTTPRKIEG